MTAWIRVTALTLLLLPAVVSAQQPESHPLAGYWKGTLATEGAAPVEFILDLRIQGEVVTGPVFTPAGEIYMQPGTVTANSISFTTPRLKDADREVALVWTGQLGGDNTLSFSVAPEDNAGAAFELVLTKNADQ